MIFKTYTCLHCEKEVTKPNVVGKYCSNACQGAAKSKKAITDWLAGKTDKVKRPLVRKWLSETRGYTCVKCGISEWQGNPITLWVDHIDGNATNNTPENFQLICPNCDSQQDTFGARNLGKGRKSRGLPQYG
jgi:DNA-directed RNA polymerase subunit RPC12/RpoP